MFLLALYLIIQYEENIMDKKVLLILVDGLRPDALLKCGDSYSSRLLEISTYSLQAKTVYPSLTLPCHMSLFHSVPPERHGILINVYEPLNHPVEGLCERLSASGKNCAFFYNWGELRDLTRPSSLAYSFYVSGDICGYEKADEMVTENALSYITTEKPDFAFVYFQSVDSAGHAYGWMGNEYCHACVQSLDRVRRLIEQFGEEYNIIVMSDHGGHGCGHGTQELEDMVIPIVCVGDGFRPGQQLQNASICDIAPTIAVLAGVDVSKDWEGGSLL